MTKFWLKHKKSIIITSFSLCLVVCLMVANELASLLIPVSSPSDSVSSSAFDLHLISLSKSQVKAESRERAKDFQVLGAGGFIWQHEGYYHVISSAYLSKNDATLVQNSIKLNHNLDSELITLNFTTHTIFGNFESEEVKVLNNMLNACLNYYSSVYDVAISLDTGVYSETNAKLAINSTQTSLATTIANFNTLFSSPLPENLSPLKNMIDQVFQIGQKLCIADKENDEQTYSSVIKYRYLEILNLYYNYIN